MHTASILPYLAGPPSPRRGCLVHCGCRSFSYLLSSIRQVRYLKQCAPDEHPMNTFFCRAVATLPSDSDPSQSSSCKQNASGYHAQGLFADFCFFGDSRVLHFMNHNLSLAGFAGFPLIGYSGQRGHGTRKQGSVGNAGDLDVTRCNA